MPADTSLIYLPTAAALLVIHTLSFAQNSSKLKQGRNGEIRNGFTRFLVQRVRGGAGRKDPVYFSRSGREGGTSEDRVATP
eukprot:1384674-Amorphochlora_amoeboformis.AAC.1